ncbi:MAG: zinc/iron-chelating domain-containing protein [Pusillimonas sp.]|nr:zinc/iron-chelating domain-containing protein [Pusillimonas sp.]
MKCRSNCGACCIAPSISSPIPGMPNGKPAGEPCVHLDTAFRCRIFNDPLRPQVCHDLQPSEDMCGDHREQALRWLGYLEDATRPSRSCRISAYKAS